MSRLRVLLAILMSLVDGLVAAGCARSDQPSAGAAGDTVTTPPSTGATLLRISGGVAHVRLHGWPAGNGATVTVARTLG
jgi:hypothetical protein